ncbi:MAG: GAF domain-containing protein [Planctomycetes bacterium]|nr:GAF domain-containing protein [Planctomycetota bacterium]MCB9884525.1 GAF domain-containing protein [Planctomycetota bacterium]
MSHHASPALSIVHLTESPEDARLLGEQIKQEDLILQVEHVRDLQALRAQLKRGPDLVIADLSPLWTDLESTLMRVLADFPEVPIVFRWGQPGNWQVEDSTEQVRRAVWNALRAQEVEGEAKEPKQQRIDQQVRLQGALLTISEFDFWDFDGCLQKTTELIAELYDVERTSVWEMTGTDEITCLDLYTRTSGEHHAGVRLTNFPKYLAALRTSLSIPATDARTDPRTSEFADYLRQHDIHSMLDAAIRKGGRVAGVICLEPVGQARQWTIAEQCGAAAVANLLARGLETRDRLQVEASLQRARKIEALGRVTAQVAHDFHNRLTVLNLLVEQLGQEGGATASRETIEQLVQELGQARQQVRRLLDLDKPQQTEAQRLDLTAAITEELPILRRLVAPSELTFVAPERPVHATMSPIDLREVLTNLVGNARDAMQAAPGTCTIQLLSADETEDGEIHLIVEDTGVGVPPEVQAQLFEPFVSTKDRGEGSGMGLASVHHTVTTAGGRVSVRTRQRHGTRVEVVLPPADAPVIT